MLKEKAIQKLERQLELINDLQFKPRFSQDFQKWKRDTEVAIEHIFGAETRHIKDFNQVQYSLGIVTTNTPEGYYEGAFRGGLATACSVLQSFIDEIQEYWNEVDINRYFPKTPETLRIIENLCNRFHLVARQLRSRHSNQPTLEIQNEYDVQDLFHALLKLYFDDIRSEEWTPSRAGSSSRMDFLLMQERTVIEIKKTRKNLAAKEVGEELIIDIERYKAHPLCETLVCFVYDPEGKIANPRGLENDLNRTNDELTVRVFITPTGA
jgi:hypothetical protein